MTTIVGQGLVQTPCATCGNTRVWILKYRSPGFDRLIPVCSGCRRARTVAENEITLNQFLASHIKNISLFSVRHE
jgi:hypothetical protein